MRTEARVSTPEIAGLRAMGTEPLSFDPALSVRAFLLERERGNVLIYNTGSLDDDLPRLREHGGAQRQYLGHWHEALFGTDGVAHDLGAKILVHSADAARVARQGWNGAYGFSRRHALDEDFEVIPIPGHTPGATAYLWDSGPRRLLFTGDSVYVRGCEWVAAILGSSDRARYAESLRALAAVEFDVLVPWAASADGPHAFETSPDEARTRLEAMAERVARGEDE